MSPHMKYQKSRENILYTWSEPFKKYFPAVSVRCDICNEIFQIKKGFFLAEDVIVCYKHMKKEWLEVKGFDVGKK